MKRERIIELAKTLALTAALIAMYFAVERIDRAEREPQTQESTP